MPPVLSSWRLRLVTAGAAALLASCPLASAGKRSNHGGKTTATPTITTAPIYLPHYSEESWEPVRGSILSSNASASETTYTIFCPTETPPACDLDLDFPFVIVEGPHTVKFHGTVTSSYTADLGCVLNGTTAATCSGYTSFRSDYFDPMFTGDTVTTWTSTLTGSEVEWGTLTLAKTPTTTTDALDLSETSTSPVVSNDFLYTPVPTGEAPGAGARVDRRLAAAMTLGGMLAARLIF